MTSRELTEAVKIIRKKDTAGATVPVVTTMTLRMSESESNIITEAIEEAKKLCESDNAVVALEMICQDWLADKGVTPERTSLDDFVTFLEATYNVKMTYKAKKKGKATKAEAKKVEKAAEKKAADRKNGKEGKEEEASIEDLLGEEEGETNLEDVLDLED